MTGIGRTPPRSDLHKEHTRKSDEAPVQPEVTEPRAEAEAPEIPSPQAREVLGHLESRQGGATTEGETQGPRARFRQQLAAFERNRLGDPEEAGRLLREVLPDLAKAIQDSPQTAPRSLARDLVSLRRFYRMGLAFLRTHPEMAGSKQSHQLQEGLDSTMAQMRTLRDSLRTTLQVPETGTSTREQVENARWAAALSDEVGHYAGLTMDLRRWSQLLDQLPQAAMDQEHRVDHRSKIFYRYTHVRDAVLGHLPREAGAPPITMSRQEIEARMTYQRTRIVANMGFISDENAQTYTGEFLDSLIQERSPANRSRLSAVGMRELVQERAEAAAAAEAEARLNRIQPAYQRSDFYLEVAQGNRQPLLSREDPELPSYWEDFTTARAASTQTEETRNAQSLALARMSEVMNGPGFTENDEIFVGTSRRRIESAQATLNNGGDLSDTEVEELRILGHRLEGMKTYGQARGLTDATHRIQLYWVSAQHSQIAGEGEAVHGALDEMRQYVDRISSEGGQINEADRLAIRLRILDARIDNNMVAGLATNMRDLQTEIQNIANRGDVDSQFLAHHLMIDYARFYYRIDNALAQRMEPIARSMVQAPGLDGGTPQFRTLGQITAELESQAQDIEDPELRHARLLQLAQGYGLSDSPGAAESLIDQVEAELTDAGEDPFIIRSRLLATCQGSGLANLIENRMTQWLEQDRQALSQSGNRREARLEMLQDWAAFAGGLQDLGEPTLAQQVIDEIGQETGELRVTERIRVYETILEDIPESVREALLDQVRQSLGNEELQVNERISLQEFIFSHSESYSQLEEIARDMTETLNTPGLTDLQSLACQRLRFRALFQQYENRETFYNEEGLSPRARGNYDRMIQTRLRFATAVFRRKLSQMSQRASHTEGGQRQALLQEINRDYQLILHASQEDQNLRNNPDEVLNYYSGWFQALGWEPFAYEPAQGGHPVPIAEMEDGDLVRAHRQVSHFQVTSQMGSRPIREEYGNFLNGLSTQERVPLISHALAQQAEHPEILENVNELNDFFHLWGIAETTLQEIPPGPERRQAIMQLYPTLSRVRRQLGDSLRANQTELNGVQSRIDEINSLASPEARTAHDGEMRELWGPAGDGGRRGSLQATITRQREQLATLESNLVGLWPQFSEGSTSPTVQRFAQAMTACARGEDARSREIFQEMLQDEAVRNDQTEEGQLLRQIAQTTISSESQSRLDRTFRVLRALASCRMYIWEHGGYATDASRSDYYAITHILSNLPEFLSTISYEELPQTFEEALDLYGASSERAQTEVTRFNGAVSRLPLQVGEDGHWVGEVETLTEGSRTGSVWEMIRSLDRLDNDGDARNIMTALRDVLGDDTSHVVMNASRSFRNGNISFTALQQEGAGDLGPALMDVCDILLEELPHMDGQLRGEIMSFRSSIPGEEESAQSNRELFSLQTAAEVALEVGVFMATGGIGNIAASGVTRMLVAATRMASRQLLESALVRGGIRLGAYVTRTVVSRVLGTLIHTPLHGMLTGARGEDLARSAYNMTVDTMITDLIMQGLLPFRLPARMARRAVGRLLTRATTAIGRAGTRTIGRLPGVLARGARTMATVGTRTAGALGRAGTTVARSTTTVRQTAGQVAVYTAVFQGAGNIRYEAERSYSNLFSEEYRQSLEDEQRFQARYNETGDPQFLRQAEAARATQLAILGPAPMNTTRQLRDGFCTELAEEMLEHFLAMGRGGHGMSVDVQIDEERLNAQERAQLQIQRNAQVQAATRLNLGEAIAQLAEAHFEDNGPGRQAIEAEAAELASDSEAYQEIREQIAAERAERGEGPYREGDLDREVRRRWIEAETLRRRHNFILEPEHEAIQAEIDFMQELQEAGLLRRFSPETIHALSQEADAIYPPEIGPDGVPRRSDANRQLLTALLQSANDEALRRNRPGEIVAMQEVADTIHPPDAEGIRSEENRRTLITLIEESRPSDLDQGTAYTEALVTAHQILSEGSPQVEMDSTVHRIDATTALVQLLSAEQRGHSPAQLIEAATRLASGELQLSRREQIHTDAQGNFEIETSFDLGEVPTPSLIRQATQAREVFQDLEPTLQALEASEGESDLAIPEGLEDAQAASRQLATLLPTLQEIQAQLSSPSLSQEAEDRLNQELEGLRSRLARSNQELVHYLGNVLASARQAEILAASQGAAAQPSLASQVSASQGVATQAGSAERSRRQAPQESGDLSVAESSDQVDSEVTLGFESGSQSQEQEGRNQEDNISAETSTEEESTTGPTPIIYRVGGGQAPAVIVASPHSTPTWRVASIEGNQLMLENVEDPANQVDVQSPVPPPFQIGDGVEIGAIGGGGSAGIPQSRSSLNEIREPMRQLLTALQEQAQAWRLMDSENSEGFSPIACENALRAYMQSLDNRDNPPTPERLAAEQARLVDAMESMDQSIQNWMDATPEGRRFHIHVPSLRESLFLGLLHGSLTPEQAQSWLELRIQAPDSARVINNRHGYFIINAQVEEGTTQFQVWAPRPNGSLMELEFSLTSDQGPQLVETLGPNLWAQVLAGQRSPEGAIQTLRNIANLETPLREGRLSLLRFADRWGLQDQASVDQWQGSHPGMAWGQSQGFDQALQSFTAQLRQQGLNAQAMAEHFNDAIVLLTSVEHHTQSRHLEEFDQRNIRQILFTEILTGEIQDDAQTRRRVRELMTQATEGAHQLDAAALTRSTREIDIADLTHLSEMTPTETDLAIEEIQHLASGQTPFRQRARQAQRLLQALDPLDPGLTEQQQAIIEDYRADINRQARMLVSRHGRLQTLLTEFLQDPSVMDRLPPFRIDNARLKDPSDLAPKLARRGAANMEELFDLLGIRLVAENREDAQELSQAIQEWMETQEEFHLDPEEIENSEMTLNSRGYRGMHLNVRARLEGPREDGRHPAAEIQIHTPASLAWGEIQRELVYKNRNNQQVPQNLHADLNDYCRQAAAYLDFLENGGETQARPTFDQSQLDQISDEATRSETLEQIEAMEALLNTQEMAASGELTELEGEEASLPTAGELREQMLQQFMTASQLALALQNPPGNQDLPSVITEALARLPNLNQNILPAIANANSPDAGSAGRIAARQRAQHLLARQENIIALLQRWQEHVQAHQAQARQARELFVDYFSLHQGFRDQGQPFDLAIHVPGASDDFMGARPSAIDPAVLTFQVASEAERRAIHDLLGERFGGVPEPVGVQQVGVPRTSANRQFRVSTPQGGEVLLRVELISPEALQDSGPVPPELAAVMTERAQDIADLMSRTEITADGRVRRRALNAMEREETINQLRVRWTEQWRHGGQETTLRESQDPWEQDALQMEESLSFIHIQAQHLHQTLSDFHRDLDETTLGADQIYQDLSIGIYDPYLRGELTFDEAMYLVNCLNSQTGEFNSDPWTEEIIHHLTTASSNAQELQIVWDRIQIGGPSPLPSEYEIRTALRYNQVNFGQIQRQVDQALARVREVLQLNQDQNPEEVFAALTEAYEEVRDSLSTDLQERIEALPEAIQDQALDQAQLDGHIFTLNEFFTRYQQVQRAQQVQNLLSAIEAVREVPADLNEILTGHINLLLDPNSSPEAWTPSSEALDRVLEFEGAVQLALRMQNELGLERTLRQIQGHLVPAESAGGPRQDRGTIAPPRRRGVAPPLQDAAHTSGTRSDQRPSELSTESPDEVTVEEAEEIIPEEEASRDTVPDGGPFSSLIPTLVRGGGPITAIGLATSLLAPSLTQAQVGSGGSTGILASLGLMVGSMIIAGVFQGSGQEGSPGFFARALSGARRLFGTEASPEAAPVEESAEVDEMDSHQDRPSQPIRLASEGTSDLGQEEFTLHRPGRGEEVGGLIARLIPPSQLDEIETTPFHLRPQLEDFTLAPDRQDQFLLHLEVGFPMVLQGQRLQFVLSRAQLSDLLGVDLPESGPVQIPQADLSLRHHAREDFDWVDVSQSNQTDGLRIQRLPSTAALPQSGSGDFTNMMAPALRPAGEPLPDGSLSRHEDSLDSTGQIPLYRDGEGFIILYLQSPQHMLDPSLAPLRIRLTDAEAQGLGIEFIGTGPDGRPRPQSITPGITFLAQDHHWLTRSRDQESSAMGQQQRAWQGQIEALEGQEGPLGELAQRFAILLSPLDPDSQAYADTLGDWMTQRDQVIAQMTQGQREFFESLRQSLENLSPFLTVAPLEGETLDTEGFMHELLFGRGLDAAVRRYFRIQILVSDRQESRVTLASLQSLVASSNIHINRILGVEEDGSQVSIEIVYPMGHESARSIPIYIQVEDSRETVYEEVVPALSEAARGRDSRSPQLLENIQHEEEIEAALAGLAQPEAARAESPLTSDDAIEDFVSGIEESTSLAEESPITSDEDIEEFLSGIEERLSEAEGIPVALDDASLEAVSDQLGADFDRLIAETENLEPESEVEEPGETGGRSLSQSINGVVGALTMGGVTMWASGAEAQDLTSQVVEAAPYGVLAATVAGMATIAGLGLWYWNQMRSSQASSVAMEPSSAPPPLAERGPPQSIAIPPGTTQFVIGSNPQLAHFHVTDPLVSRAHCLVAQDPNGDWHIMDRSLNGTQILQFGQASRLQRDQWRPISNGDIIRLPNGQDFRIQLPTPALTDAGRTRGDSTAESRVPPPPPAPDPAPARRGPPPVPDRARSRPVPPPVPADARQEPSPPTQDRSAPVLSSSQYPSEGTEMVPIRPGVQLEIVTGEAAREVELEAGNIAASAHNGIGYKSSNEDRVHFVTFEDGRSVLIAIDGMGGHAGGERAADIARLTMARAIEDGHSVEEAIQMAHDSIRTDTQNRGQGGGAVGVGVEITPNGDGTYQFRETSVGDAEAVALRMNVPSGQSPVVHHTTRASELVIAMAQAQNRPYQQTPDRRLQRGQTLELHLEEQANVVMHALGKGAGELPTQSSETTLNEGDVVLLGSDGFFENFGSLDLVGEIIRAVGAQTPTEIRDALMREVLVRQQLRAMARRGGSFDISVPVLESIYRRVSGGESAPTGWVNHWNRLVRQHGRMTVQRDGRVQNAAGEDIDYLKSDNVSLVVQVLGGETSQNQTNELESERTRTRIRIPTTQSTEAPDTPPAPPLPRTRTRTTPAPPQSTRATQTIPAGPSTAGPAASVFPDPEGPIPAGEYPLPTGEGVPLGRLEAYGVIEIFEMARPMAWLRTPHSANPQVLLAHGGPRARTEAVDPCALLIRDPNTGGRRILSQGDLTLYRSSSEGFESITLSGGQQASLVEGDLIITPSGRELSYDAETGSLLPGSQDGDIRLGLRIPEAQDTHSQRIQHLTPDQDVGHLLMDANIENVISQISGLNSEAQQALREYWSLFEMGSVVSPESHLRWGYLFWNFRSGAQTMQANEVSPAVYQAYQAYRRHFGFPEESPLASDSPELESLRELGRALGTPIDPQAAITPTQYRYIYNIIRMFPPGILRSPFLRQINLGTSRRGSALMSSFNDGVVNLYTGTLRGPRRNLLGLLIHEIGHSTEQRYGLGNQGDPAIPEEIRREIREDHHAVISGSDGNVAFALDWLDGREGRRSYVGHFEEFIAEFHVHYMIAGDQLRHHISSISSQAQREAYYRIYQELRYRIFGDQQYGANPWP